MASGIIGRKLGMTRVFADDGTAVPVTVIEAGPCPVVQVREEQAQLGFGAGRRRRGRRKAEAGPRQGGGARRRAAGGARASRCGERPSGRAPR